MTPGIHIKDDTIIFQEYHEEDLGAKHCESFKIRFDDIKCIAISPRLYLDDETMFVLLVTRSDEILPMPDTIFNTSQFKQFWNEFEIQDIQELWGRFSYEDHYGRHDKIVFPENLFWVDLFEQDWKIWFRQLYSWIEPKSFLGTVKKTLHNNH